MVRFPCSSTAFLLVIARVRDVSIAYCISRIAVVLSIVIPETVSLGLYFVDLILGIAQHYTQHEHAHSVHAHCYHTIIIKLTVRPPTLPHP